MTGGLMPAGREAQQGVHEVIWASTWYYVGALSSLVGVWLAGLGAVTGGSEP